MNQLRFPFLLVGGTMPPSLAFGIGTNAINPSVSPRGGWSNASYAIRPTFSWSSFRGALHLLLAAKL